MYMMPKLITLLTVNQFGAAGATQLADALQRNSTLTDLRLSGKHSMICAVVCLHIIIFICLTAFCFVEHKYLQTISECAHTFSQCALSFRSMLNI